MTVLHSDIKTCIDLVQLRYSNYTGSGFPSNHYLNISIRVLADTHPDDDWGWADRKDLRITPEEFLASGHAPELMIEALLPEGWNMPPITANFKSAILQITEALKGMGYS